MQVPGWPVVEPQQSFDEVQAPSEQAQVPFSQTLLQHSNAWLHALPELLQISPQRFLNGSQDSPSSVQQPPGFDEQSALAGRHPLVLQMPSGVAFAVVLLVTMHVAPAQHCSSGLVLVGKHGSSSPRQVGV